MARRLLNARYAMRPRRARYWRLPEPDGVPDEFILALSSDGAARRRCRVAWRTENQIGVEFLKDLKKNAPPMRKTAMRSSVPRSADAKASAESAERVDIDTLTPR